MSAWVGTVRGSMRGLALTALLSACAVYDDSLLEGQATGDLSATTTTSSGATGGTSSSVGGTTASAETTSSSTGGAPSTTTGMTMATTTGAGSSTTTSGSGGTTSTTTGTGGGGGGSGGSGATGSGGSGATGSGGSGATGGSGGTCTDCEDLCPDDPDKTDPGVCGCDIPDSGAGSCVGLVDGLVHRYSFDGTGTEATDSVGQEHGVVVNTTLDGSGVLTLAGVDSDEYVELPGGIISALGDATFEVWFNWDGGANWQRVFDFGNTQNGAQGEQGTGKSYFFLTPRNSTQNLLQVTFANDGFNSEVYLEGAAEAPSGVVVHLAAVVDDTNDTLTLYIDGELEATTALAGSLSELTDINNWLGRSQYGADDEFGGTIDEFRIYGVALSATEITLSYDSGPDPDFLAQ